MQIASTQTPETPSTPSGAAMKNRNRRGFSLMELMIAIGIASVFLAVALPKFKESRIQANEINAIRMIGTIHTAQANFQSLNGRFAVALPELSRFLTAKLAAGQHSGYNFIVEGTNAGYHVVAKPEKPGSTGTRTFHSDEDLAVLDENGKDIAH